MNIASSQVRGESKSFLYVMHGAAACLARPCGALLHAGPEGGEVILRKDSAGMVMEWGYCNVSMCKYWTFECDSVSVSSSWHLRDE